MIEKLPKLYETRQNPITLVWQKMDELVDASNLQQKEIERLGRLRMKVIDLDDPQTESPQGERTVPELVKEMMSGVQNSFPQEKLEEKYMELILTPGTRQQSRYGDPVTYGIENTSSKDIYKVVITRHHLK